MSVKKIIHKITIENSLYFKIRYTLDKELNFLYAENFILYLKFSC